ncbi:MAG: FkbM family methyltransferase [Candidatus Hydrogenedentota bacterium]
MALESIARHTIETRFLGADSRVVDLGANEGAFAWEVIERFGCECAAAEAAPDVCRAIPDRPGLRKYNLAITGSNGEVELQLSPRSTANSVFKRDGVHTASVKTPSQTLDSFIQQLGWDTVDLLKMDIEGSEIEVLRTCDEDALRRIGQITVEFHDFMGLVPRDEVDSVMQRLQALGFYCIRMAGRGHEDTWFLNRAMLDIPSSELWRMEHLTRNWREFLRITGLKKRQKSRRKNTRK